MTTFPGLSYIKNVRGLGICSLLFVIQIVSPFRQSLRCGDKCIKLMTDIWSIVNNPLKLFIVIFVQDKLHFTVSSFDSFCFFPAGTHVQKHGYAKGMKNASVFLTISFQIARQGYYSTTLPEKARDFQ